MMCNIEPACCCCEGERDGAVLLVVFFSVFCPIAWFFLFLSVVICLLDFIDLISRQICALNRS